MAATSPHTRPVECLRVEVSDMRRVLTSVLVAGLLMTAGAGAQQRPQDIKLQAAIRTETVTGDLKKALSEYQAIVDAYAKTDRAVAADALMRMAECYRKLGDQQAIKVFERVVREFGDQKQAADVARAHLASVASTAPPGTVNRQLWTGPDVDTMGTITADGRYLSFTDWNTGNLAIRDMSHGTWRPLTNKAGYDDNPDYAEESSISRDGTHVAYSWFNDKSNRYDVRLLKIDAAPGTAPRMLYDNPDVSWIAPYDWTPDGQSIVVQLQRKDQTAQIGLIAVKDGSFRALKSIEWQGSSRIFLSPDGTQIAYDLPQQDNRAKDVFVLRTDGSREVAIAPHRAMDLVAGWSPDGGSVLFASDRAGSLGLWSVGFANGQPSGAPALIKADLGPFITSVGMTRAGAFVYGVRTRAAKVLMASVDLDSGKLVSGPSEPFENYLSPMRGPAWSPDGRRIVAILDQRRNRVLAIRSLDGTEARDLDTGLGYVLRPHWAPDGSITVQGLDLKGHKGIFRVDAYSGAATPIVLGEVALSAWLPDGKTLVYQRIEGGKSHVVIRDTASGQEREILETAPRFDQSWNVSPNGRLLAYVVRDRNAGTSTLNVMSIDGAESRELHRLTGAASHGNKMWTPDSRSLLFATVDGGKRGGYRINVDNGTLRPLDPSFPLQAKLDPEGRRVVYHSGGNAFELWTLENFLPRPAATTSTKR